MSAVNKPVYDVTEKKYASKKEIRVARNEYQTDDIEIDDNALVSRAPEDRGRWVAAWVWVSNEIMKAHK